MTCWFELSGRIVEISQNPIDRTTTMDRTEPQRIKWNRRHKPRERENSKRIHQQQQQTDKTKHTTTYVINTFVIFIVYMGKCEKKKNL